MIAYKLAFLTLFAVNTFAVDFQSSVAATIASTEGFDNEEDTAYAARTSAKRKLYDDKMRRLTNIDDFDSVISDAINNEGSGDEDGSISDEDHISSDEDTGLENVDFIIKDAIDENGQDSSSSDEDSTSSSDENSSSEDDDEEESDEDYDEDEIVEGDNEEDFSERMRPPRSGDNNRELAAKVRRNGYLRHA